MLRFSWDVTKTSAFWSKTCPSGRIPSQYSSAHPSKQFHHKICQFVQFTTYSTCGKSHEIFAWKHKIVPRGSNLAFLVKSEELWKGNKAIKTDCIKDLLIPRPPSVVFRQPPNLKKHLVRASFKQPPFPNGEDEENRPHGCYKHQHGGEVEDAYSTIH